MPVIKEQDLNNNQQASDDNIEITELDENGNEIIEMSNNTNNDRQVANRNNNQQLNKELSAVILPEIFYRIIAKNIAIAQYDSRIYSAESRDINGHRDKKHAKDHPFPHVKFIRNEFMKFKIPEHLLTEDWKNIETSEEFAELIRKMKLVSNEIYILISNIRSNLHIDMYRSLLDEYCRDEEKYKSIEKEASLYIDSKYVGRYLYTDRVNVRLKYYLNMVEDTIKKDLNSETIDISTIKKWDFSDCRGQLHTDSISFNREMRRLVSFARHEPRWYELMFRKARNGSNFLGIRDNPDYYQEDPETGKLHIPNFTTFEYSIIKEFTKYLVLEIVELVKEKTKHLPEEEQTIISENSEEYFATQEEMRIAKIERERWIKQPVRDAALRGLEHAGSVLVKVGGWTRHLCNRATGYDTPTDDKENSEQKGKKKSEAEFLDVNRLMVKDRELLQAAASCDRDQLFSLLKSGADIKASDDKGRDILKLISINTRANLIGYILSFFVRLDRYKLYYEAKDYIKSYDIAEKRIKASGNNNKSQIVNEANHIYLNDRAKHDSITYDKIISEDASLCGYRNSNWASYILSFIIQTEAYREAGYYHVRDNRVKFAKQNKLTDADYQKYKPSFAEKIGYKTSVFSR